MHGIDGGWLDKFYERSLLPTLLKKNNKIGENVNKVSKLLFKGLREIELKTGSICSIRGEGLMIGFEVSLNGKPSKDRAEKLAKTYCEWSNSIRGRV